MEPSKLFLKLTEPQKALERTKKKKKKKKKLFTTVTKLFLVHWRTIRVSGGQIGVEPLLAPILLK